MINKGTTDSNFVWLSSTKNLQIIVFQTLSFFIFPETIFYSCVCNSERESVCVEMMMNDVWNSKN